MQKIQELTPIEAYLLGIERSIKHYTAQGLSHKAALYRVQRLGHLIDEDTVRLAAHQGQQRQAAIAA